MKLSTASAALKGMGMADLILPLKREYFEQIRAGEKWFEYRLFSQLPRPKGRSLKGKA